ncbi:MAG: LLM class flavin-dependent oxidoreductase [Lapillicoccus sp.]
MGLLAPLLPAATASGDLDAVRRAISDGVVDAVWVRDLPVVPVGDPDAGQFDDPFAYLARLAPDGVTGLTLGTASVILGVRHPLVVARAAAAAQVVAAGRFVLGVGSGGKPAMNDVLGLGDRSDDLFAARWRALRAAVHGHVGAGVQLDLPGPLTPPPLYLASARRSHWAAIDGDADGWMAFLDGWPLLDQTLSAVTMTRGGNAPPMAVRVDLTLDGGPFRLGERGRLHCSPDVLADVFRRLRCYPVEHVMIRVVGPNPQRDLRAARAVWDGVT